MPVTEPAERCVAHPSRPSVGRCPVCARPRCGADARGPGCAVCHGGPSVVTRRPPPEGELVVRAALAAYGMAMLAGVVLQEYPGAPWFKYLAPAVGGVACGLVATAAAGEPRGSVLQRVRLVAVVYAVLATALGFVLDGTYGVLDAKADVLLPYVCAAGACWLWTAPPRRRVKASTGG